MPYSRVPARWRESRRGSRYRETGLLPTAVFEYSDGAVLLDDEEPAGCVTGGVREVKRTVKAGTDSFQTVRAFSRRLRRF